jgi:Ca2+/Na+ antiporter
VPWLPIGYNFDVLSTSEKRRLITNVLGNVLQVKNLGYTELYSRFGNSEFSRTIPWLASELLHRVESPALPNKHETAAVALGNPKTAALCFDRVWSGASGNIPESIDFSGTTDVEVRFLAFVSLARCADLIEHEEARRQVQERCFRLLEGDLQGLVSPLETPYMIDAFTRAIADRVNRGYRLSAATAFRYHQDCNAAYRPGSRASVIAVLSEVPVVSEENLGWDQVQQVRADNESQRRLKRLMHWLDSEMAGKSPSFIADEIEERLHEYKLTLRKHGLETSLGTISSILDSKLLVGGAAAVASVTYASDAFAGLIAGAALLVSNVALHAAKALLDHADIRARTQKQIAFVAEIDRLAKKPTA